MPSDNNKEKLGGKPCDFSFIFIWEIKFIYFDCRLGGEKKSFDVEAWRHLRWC